MKRSLLNKWIARLEDPNAKQAREVLRDENGGMCCLGVLCDIVNPNNWDYDDEQASYFWYVDLDSHLGGGRNKDDTSLPTILAEGLGMKSTGAYLPDYESGINSDLDLAQLNDEGKTFAEIAHILRTRPLDYIEEIEEDV